MPLQHNERKNSLKLSSLAPAPRAPRVQTGETTKLLSKNLKSLALLYGQGWPVYGLITVTGGESRAWW